MIRIKEKKKGQNALAGLEHGKEAGNKNRFLTSSRLLKDTRTLIMLSMFMALSIAVSSFRIRTPAFSVSLSPLIKMYVALLYGPVSGAVYGFTLDLLQFFIANTGDAFFPGYTLTETLGIFLYALFLYQRKLSFLRVLLAKFTVVLICNILLGTLWLSMMTGEDIATQFLYYLPLRTVKNLIQWVVDSILFYLLADSLKRASVTKILMGQEPVS